MPWIRYPANPCSTGMATGTLPMVTSHTNRIRVLHLIDSPNRRGAELFALDLAESLPPREFESVVVSLFRPDPGDPLASPLLKRMDGRPGKLEKLFGLNWWLLARIDRIAARQKTQVIISHGGSTLKYAVGLSLIRPRAQLIYRCIGSSSFWTRSKGRAWVMKALLVKTDTVVCTNGHDCRDFTEMFGSRGDAMHVIDNGIDMNRITEVRHGAEPAAAIRASVGVPPEDALLISVGSLSHEKNHRDTLHVLKKLGDQGIKATAIIVGEGPLKSRLIEQSVSLGISESVHLVGERTDVVEWLRAADVFVLPSLTEGMPAAMIEAGVVGLPVVSYGVGGVPEVITPGVDGFFVPVGDVEAMTLQVAKLVRNSGLAGTIGREAQRRWTERFDINRVASSYARLMRNSVGAAAS